MPWAYFADTHIVSESERTFTGFYSYGNNYGKPGLLLTAIAIIALIFILLPRIWAKRANLFVCALGVGYAIKSYVLFTSCYNAYCPEKRAGVYLMLSATILMLIASALPKFQLEDKKKKPEINPV